MNQRHHVGRLDVVNVKEIGLKVRRLDLVWLSIDTHHSLALCMKPHVLLTKLKHHGLSDRKVERDEASLLALVLRTIDVL